MVNSIEASTWGRGLAELASRISLTDSLRVTAYIYISLKYYLSSMKRRGYLAILGGVSGAIAGCAGSNDEQGPEDATSTSTTKSTSTVSTTTSVEPAAFEVAEILAPNSVALGENFRIEIKVRNTGGKTATWHESLYMKATSGGQPSDFNQYSIEMVVPPGEAQIWRSNEISYDVPGVLYFRVGDQGATRKVEFPASKTPIITDANLVSEWNNYGDTIQNSISSAARGSWITIANRYWYYTESKTLNVFNQVKVFTESGERVALKTNTDEQVTDTNYWTSWEYASQIDTTGWSGGEYTAEVLVRDNEDQLVSNAATVEFTLE